MKKSVIARLIHKKTARALRDYSMIVNRDRVLVAISGQDSLALLQVLQEKANFLPIKYKLIAAHVNLNPVRNSISNWANHLNAKVIERQLKKKGIEYHMLEVDLDKGKKERKTSECFWCSWKRREALFKLADALKCKKIALAHHLDDIVETYLLNIFFQGELSTMPPKLRMFDGRFHIIRPFAYLEKKVISEYAKIRNIPQMPYQCPFGQTSNRTAMRKIIGSLQKKRPKVKENIFKSMSNINRLYLPKKDN
ncbi:MAG: hypothetical protein JW869_06930 [Candidatus Omnitrophica bacterium]|nr:hypothetical protein [Candidatus Omnitrophota bacterium]